MRKFKRNIVWVIIFTAAWAAATILLRPATVLGRVDESFDSIPRNIGGWVGTDIDPGDSALAIPNSSVLMRNYANHSGQTVTLAVVYGFDLSDIHKPEYCMEGSGWRAIAGRVVVIDPTSAPEHGAKLLTLRAPDSSKILCLYWFAGPGGSTHEFSSRKLAVFLNALSGRAVPTALVRLTMPVSVNGHEEEQRMMDLARMLDGHVFELVSRSADSDS